MWWMKCVAVLAVSVVLRTSASTDTTPATTDTVSPPIDEVGPLPVLPPFQATQQPQLPQLPVNANLRYSPPIRTGGKPLPTAQSLGLAPSSFGQDENYITDNTDPSSGDVPNFIFVPILSQSYYFPDRSYHPMMRNYFTGDRPQYGLMQDTLRRNVDNALYDSYFSRQNQQGVTAGSQTFGGGMNIADRFSAFREWLMSLIPFRIEFVRPTNPGARPLLVGIPQNNVPSLINYVPNSNVPSKIHFIPGNFASTTNNKPNNFQNGVNNNPSSVNYVPNTANNNPSAINYVPNTANNNPSAVNYVPNTANNNPSTVNYVPNNFPSTTSNIPNNYPSQNNFPVTPNNAQNTGIHIPNSVNNNMPDNFATTANKIPNPENNFPITSDNVQNTAGNFPAGFYRRRFVPNDHFNRGFSSFPQNEYLQPSSELTQRNYQPMLNNYRDIPHIHPYAYRPYSPHNVDPNGQTRGISKGFNPSSGNE